MTVNMDVHTTLERHLRDLHLPAFRECYQDAAQKAQQESLSYEQYLLELADRECETRRINRIERVLRQSKLLSDKQFDSFNMKRLPTKLARQVRSLLDGGFVDRCENILAFGKPGSGKTHVLSAISHELVRMPQ